MLSWPQGQFITELIHQPIPPWAAAQSRGFPLALVVTGPCCYRTMDPDVAPSISTDEDPAMPLWSQVASPASHIRLFLTTLEPPLLPLHCAPIFPSLMFFHFSTIYLLFFITPRFSEYLAWSQEWYLEFYA